MPPKQKADTAGYQQLKKDLAGGEPGRLYLFHGEETYLRDHYLGRLKELLLTGGMGEFNLHTIPAREMSPRRLEEAVDCLPMMAPRTLVLVRDFDLFKAGEKDREEYARAFAQLPDYCCLVFVYDLIPYKGDARTKLAAAIKQNGTVVNFARQDQGDLVDWVRRRFRALGKEIDTRLACDLIFLCGDLMTNLIGEIEKIGAYAKGGRITREDIDAVATPQLDAVVFRMTDAIGEGNFDRAASVLGELYQMQEPPIRIMWSLGRQMRQLYSARLAIEKGKGAPYVAGLWGLKPYPADKLMTSARRFSLSWCRRAVVRCGQTDLAMKSTGQDAQELLTGLLLELAAPRPGSLVVVGCSSSEIVGGHIGKDSSMEAAAAVLAGVLPVLKAQGVYLAAQCCEHLNRAIVIEQEAAEKYGYEQVNAVPQPHAGGSWATNCWQAFEHPVLVEEVRAAAGIDIGGTLIGMHLKRVAVPVRLTIKQIGAAPIICARTRPKYIGGSRAVYQEM